MRRAHFFSLLILGLCYSSPSIVHARPEYAAFNGSNCMSCHVGPVGGFGRKPMSPQDPGFITDKFSMSGDMLFMALYDQRQGQKDRFVLFPMQAALNFAITPTPNLTMALSSDFGYVREAYGMIHDVNQTMYVRAGLFTLPYGQMFPDHTAFVKEGRVETGEVAFEEKGIGAELFSVRYKDQGVEAGLSGRPWFLNLAVTSGVVGADEQTTPSNQGGTKRAITRRAGYIGKNFSLGASMYTNDNEIIDRRILRYGGFGWVRGGPFVLQFEHDEGEDEPFTVSGSTQISASYVELVFEAPFLEHKWQSYTKIRYERLDPNRSIDGDLLQRAVLSFEFQPSPYINVESVYRKNFEQPNELNNDDIYVITHFHLD